jgi:hypothetical protein
LRCGAPKIMMLTAAQGHCGPLTANVIPHKLHASAHMPQIAQSELQAHFQAMQAVSGSTLLATLLCDLASTYLLKPSRPPLPDDLMRNRTSHRGTLWPCVATQLVRDGEVTFFRQASEEAPLRFSFAIACA